jgi:Flp pilus assembly protein TadD
MSLLYRALQRAGQTEAATRPAASGRAEAAALGSLPKQPPKSQPPRRAPSAPNANRRRNVLLVIAACCAIAIGGLFAIGPQLMLWLDDKFNAPPPAADARPQLVNGRLASASAPVTPAEPEAEAVETMPPPSEAPAAAPEPEIETEAEAAPPAPSIEERAREAATGGQPIGLSNVHELPPLPSDLERLAGGQRPPAAAPPPPAARQASRTPIVTVTEGAPWLRDRREHALALMRSGDFENALSAWTAILERFPGDVAALTGRAQCLERLGDPDAAILAWQSVLRADPNALPARVSLLGLQGRSDPDGAVAALEALARDNPADASIPEQMGLIRAGQMRDDAAVDYLYRAAMMAPENAAYQLNLAISFDRLGRRSDAITFYGASLIAQRQRPMPLPLPEASIRARIDWLQRQG